MKIKPIDIQVTGNDKDFENIAFLVDRDDFLSDITIIRKKIRLSKLLTLGHYKRLQKIKANLLNHHLYNRTVTMRNKLSKYLKAPEFKNCKNTNEYKSLYEDIHKALPKGRALTKKERQLMQEHDSRFINKEYKQMVKSLQEKYVRNEMHQYYAVISNAIIYGAIPSNSLSKSWYFEFNNDAFKSFDLDPPYMKICISDRITKNQILIKCIKILNYFFINHRIQLRIFAETETGTGSIKME